MRKQVLTAIISGIIFVATLLRVYRLDSLTEFLGDQGRTMLIMRDFLLHGIIPLTGPTTLSGHFLGPVFYYLLVPGYLLFGGPIGVSLWMALLGVASVYLVYRTARMMFGLSPAIFVSLLWAVSPSLVTSDRTIWEPNLVPLFSLLFVYLLYRANKNDKPLLWILLGLTVGVLVQLHYPNIFFIGLIGMYFLYDGVKKKRIYPWFLWVFGFIFSLLPFLWYEYTVSFKDVLGIASIILSGGGEALGKRAILLFGVDYGARVWGTALPFISQTVVSLLLFCWALFVGFHPTKKNIFLSVWLGLGLAAMARFSGVVHNHYLYFLTPVPFLMMGAVIHEIKDKKIVSIVMVPLCLFMLSKTDMFAPGNNDIVRISANVKALKEEVGEDPFSFTLLDSKSFSDLHYRYYMDVLNLYPTEINDPGYQKLIIMCDAEACILPDSEIQALCYDEHCNKQYSTIDIASDWKYIATKGRLYIFERL